MLRHVCKQALRSSRATRAPVVRSFSSTMAKQSTPLFVLTDEEEMFRETVEKFSNEVVAPRVRDMDEKENMDPEIVKGMFETGLMAIETPEELGGAGASFTSAILVIEELAKVDPSVSVLNDVHNTLVSTFVKNRGSKELKEKYMPQLASGVVGSFGLTEPSSGSDAFALKSRAVKVEGGYKLTGTKLFITNAQEAGLFIIMANLDPSKGYKGITAFLAEREWGVEIARKEKKLGIRASSTCEISFNDLFIPAENLLGKEGEGYKYAIEMLNEGRIGIAAQMTGLAMGSFNRATDYAFNDRKQFGKLIGENQGLQFQIAEAATEIEAARLLVYNAARRKEAGLPFVKEAAMAKLYASEMAQRVASSAVDWMGGAGFIREDFLEKNYRDSKIGTIYEGTSNIQKQTIAKLLQKELTK